jgi:hypothetical protein
MDFKITCPRRLSWVSSNISQIGLWTSQILPELGSLGKAEPSHVCVKTALFMRPRWLVPKAATFFIIKTHLSRGLARNSEQQTPYAVDATGGGRNSAISRKMSANKFLGMATSAI